MYVASREHYRRALRTRRGGERTMLRAAMLLALGRTESVLQAFGAAEKTLSQLLREFPDHPDAEVIRREIADARRPR